MKRIIFIIIFIFINIQGNCQIDFENDHIKWVNRVIYRCQVLILPIPCNDIQYDYYAGIQLISRELICPGEKYLFRIVLKNINDKKDFAIRFEGDNSVTFITKNNNKKYQAGQSTKDFPKNIKNYNCCSDILYDYPFTLIESDFYIEVYTTDVSKNFRIVSYIPGYNEEYKIFDFNSSPCWTIPSDTKPKNYGNFLNVSATCAYLNKDAEIEISLNSELSCNNISCLKWEKYDFLSGTWKRASNVITEFSEGKIIGKIPYNDSFNLELYRFSVLHSSQFSFSSPVKVTHVPINCSS